MIYIKTPEEIILIREAGKRLAHVVRETALRAAPGVTLRELDTFAENCIVEMGDLPAFKNYRPEGMPKAFPATLCTSVNDAIVHGIPTDYVLKEGDILSIDCGLRHKGYFADHAVTIAIGKISHDAANLLAITEEALRVGIEAIVPGARTGDVGAAVEQLVDKKYGIVKGLAGHGVGKYIHEDPFIPNYGKRGTGELLVPGMTVAIEPMLTIGKEKFDVLPDQWTCVTRDGSLAAHFEHTVLITEDGYEILTQ